MDDGKPRNVVDETTSQPQDASLTATSVASFFNVDEALIRNIPAELANKLAHQAQKFEVLKNEKLMSEVNFEQSIHSLTSNLATTKTQLSQAKEKETELSEQIASLKDQIKTFQDEKHTMDSNVERSGAVVESLKSDIALLESEKRRLMESLESRGGDFATLRADLEAAQARNGEHRRVIVELEAQVQKEHATVLQIRFKEEQLKQETQLLKKSNEWLDAELKAKQEEHSNFRRDKAQLVARLQSELEQTAADRDGLRASLETARSSHSSASTKVDELLTRNKQLQDAAVVAEENFRREMQAQKRLAQLYEKSATDAKARIKELETGGNAKLRTALEQEREKNGILESKLDAVEKQLQELHSMGATTSTKGTPVPTTPHRGSGLSGGAGTPFSPSAKIVSELNKGGISLVQLYADYQDVCKRLEKERSRNEELQSAFDNLLEEMEQHTPAILAERDECKRLEGELVQLSVHLQEVSDARDKLAADSEKAEVATRDGQRELKLLQQQLGDASRQIQHLLVQQKMREGNSGPLTVTERESLNDMLSGNLDVSDTDRVISERLVVFADIISMQKQNERLLRISRELGQKLEAKEAEARDAMANIESAAVKEAHEALESVVNDMERLQSRYEAVSRERDMFRRISGNRDNNDDATTNNTTTAVGAKRSETIEAEWSAYKTETDVTLKSLNTQISSLSDERHTLQINLSKAESQCALLGERLQNLKSNNESALQEREQLRRRVEHLQEAATRQEIRTQTATEDVVATRATCDQLKGEVSNLQAEKRVWKSIEQRITKDNVDLIEEKTRLNGVIAQMQVAESERSTQEAESRKRLLEQLETLEKRKDASEKELQDSRAELKKMSDRRDIEQVQYQERIDALIKETGVAREQLAASKAEVSALKEQCAKLESQVTSLTQQVAVLLKQNEGDEATQLGRVKNELAAANNELTKVKSELASSAAQVEQFKNIAQAAEESLGNMVASYDEYKESIQEKLEQQTKALSGLEEQNKVLSDELKLAQNEIDVLQRQEGEQISSIVEEKRQLLGQIESLKAETAVLSTQTAEIKTQLQETSAASATYQSNYESELVKHAEAANSLIALRTEYNEAKTKIAASSAEAKSAKEQLEFATESWDSQKSALENEISKLKSRVDDVVSQNNILLDSLDKRKTHASTGNGATSDDSTSSDVFTYLRQEKEIIETQYELAIQENKRLQARLDHTSTSLDEARSDLERIKATAEDGAKIESAQKELADKMEQLSVFRESNQTLRMECEASNREVARLQAAVADLEAKLEPFENQLSDREAEIEAQKGEISLLKEDNERWKNRTQQILQRHERVDPAELESFKTALQAKEKELENAKTQLEEGSKKLEEGSKKLHEVQKELDSTKSRLARLKEEASRKLKHAQQVKNATQQELATAQAALAEARKAGSDGSKANKAEVESLRRDVQRLTSELEQANAKVSETQAKLDSANTQVTETQEKLSAATAEVNETKSKLAAASANASKLTKEMEKAKKEIEETVTKNVSASMVTGDAEGVTLELNAARAEIEKLKKEVDTAQAVASSGTAPSDDFKNLSEKITELQGELARKEEELKNAVMPEELKTQIATLEAKVIKLETEKKAVQEELDKVQDELKQLKEDSAKATVEGAPQSPPSDEAYRLQVREELLASLKKEHDDHIKSVRAEMEAPLNAWKLDVRKQANEKVKEKIDALNTEWEKKLAAKEAEMNEANPEFQARLKKEIEKARNSEKSMADMRQKLLTSKVAKLEAELKSYTEGAAGGSSTNDATGAAASGIPRPQTRIPGPAGRGGRGASFAGRGGRGDFQKSQRPSIVRPGAAPTAVANAAPFVPGAAPSVTPTGPKADPGVGGNLAKRPLTEQQPDAQKKRKDD